MSPPEVGDLVAVLDVGAYGFTESMPLFLSHPIPAEVAVRGGRADAHPAARRIPAAGSTTRSCRPGRPGYSRSMLRPQARLHAPMPRSRGRSTRPRSPDSTERRRAGGAARARWEALLAGGGPVLADGAMGTMLFAAGLQFGDPPEVWNLSHPDVVRRIHRGYLDAGSRIVMTNTFGGNRLRLGLHRLEGRVAELNRTAAILLRGEVDAHGGEALVAGDIGPSGAIMAPTGTLDYDGGGRRLRRAGRGADRRRRRPHLDRDDVRPGRDRGRDRRRPARLGGHPADRHHDLRHPRATR